MLGGGIFGDLGRLSVNGSFLWSEELENLMGGSVDKGSGLM